MGTVVSTALIGSQPTNLAERRDQPSPTATRPRRVVPGRRLPRGRSPSRPPQGYSPEARFSSAISAFNSATSACSVRRSVA